MLPYAEGKEEVSIYENKIKSLREQVKEKIPRIVQLMNTLKVLRFIQW